MTPADIAVVRRLLAHAKAQGWEPGGPAHSWVTPRSVVTVLRWGRGGLRLYASAIANYSSNTNLDATNVTSAQQAADLLAAVGLVPAEMTSGWLVHRDQLAARLDQLVSAYIDTADTIPLPAEEAINHA